MCTGRGASASRSAAQAPCVTTRHADGGLKTRGSLFSICRPRRRGPFEGAFCPVARRRFLHQLPPHNVSRQLLLGFRPWLACACGTSPFLPRRCRRAKGHPPPLQARIQGHLPRRRGVLGFHDVRGCSERCHRQDGACWACGRRRLKEAFGGRHARQDTAAASVSVQKVCVLASAWPRAWESSSTLRAVGQGPD